MEIILAIIVLNGAFSKTIEYDMSSLAECESHKEELVERLRKDNFVLSAKCKIEGK